MNEQQQQSKQIQNNDECSSGGTTPTPVQGSSDGISAVNRVKLIIQLTVLVEECIFDKFKDSKCTNYKTLLRRITQAIR